MDLPAPIDDRGFQAPPAVGELLPSARTADLSEDGEALDSDDDDDDDLPSVKQILASSKRAKRVIDLTGDDREGGDGELAQNHPNGSTSGKTNSTLLDRPHPDHRPTPFPLHRPL